MIRKRGRRKKRVCQCCADKVTTVDYKDISKLRRYVSERGKILPRRITGNCAPESADNSNQESKTRIPDALYTGLIRYCFGRSAGFALFLAEKQEKP